ncbi:MAG: hypothetical protein H0W24_09605 [Lysobacter sp.]|nr:hypothetical protein [Lysobacter sp.]
MGALMLALLWIYYSALVVFLGALITAVFDERAKARKSRPGTGRRAGRDEGKARGDAPGGARTA